MNCKIELPQSIRLSSKVLPVLLFLLFSQAMLFAKSIPVRGTVVDATGGPLEAAQVTVTSGDKQAAATLTNQHGEFTVSLPSGEYRISVTTANFSTFEETVIVRRGMKALSFSMSLAPFPQTMDVEDQPYEIALDPDRNLSGLTFSDSDIENIPEDEDEMAQYLADLAGPGASAVGGAETLVDGFNGGRLPPRDQIQEIRINNNPYSSEFSRPGHGRIEIRTRAGSDALRGNLGFNLRDDALNARNAFADQKPPYQRRNLRGSLSGPIIKNRMSFSVNGRRSDAQDNDSVNAFTINGDPLNYSITRPNMSQEFGGRTQINLPRNQSLNLNVEYQSDRRSNEGVGGFTLLDRATSSDSREISFRASETAALSERMVNEFRFGFERQVSSTTPLTSAIAINVQDAFQSGGAPRLNEATERNFQFADQMSWSRGNLSMKGGFQGNLHQFHTLSRDNFLGTYEFASLDSYRAGAPITFTVNSGNPALDMNQFESGMFLQSDYRVAPTLMLSFGARYEAQNNISDANNVDPRFGFAFSVGKSSVLRGGAGLFHQRLNANTVQSVLRLDGTRQIQTVIQNPAFPNPLAGGGVAEVRLPSSLREADADLALPYTMNSSISYETRLPRGLFVSLNYDHIRGVHLYRNRNLNAPLPGFTTRPDPSRGNILLLESTAASRYQGVSININQRLGRRSVNGNYTYSLSNNNSDGPFSLPANNYDLRGEWGRSADNQRHTAILGFNTPLPLGIEGNTRIRTTSSRPFNITTGTDDNFDTTTNDRPVGVERNTGIGPAFFQLDVTLRRSFSLRRAQPVQAAPQGGQGGRQRGGQGGRQGGGQGGPQGGGQHGGQAPPVSNFVSNFQRPGGGPGGPPQTGNGGGPGGGGGGRGGNNQRVGPQLALTLNITNLFNHTNPSRYSGVQTSPFFGRANSARAPREIEIGVQLSF
ncbi:MAG: hypothetical protein EXQ56_09590 [Acidobacteria bacterium]|nr:hypothetical protein [Acidobacteriota bacterium]